MTSDTFEAKCLTVFETDGKWLHYFESKGGFYFEVICRLQLFDKGNTYIFGTPKEVTTK